MSVSGTGPHYTNLPFKTSASDGSENLAPIDMILSVQSLSRWGWGLSNANARDNKRFAGRVYIYAVGSEKWSKVLAVRVHQVFERPATVG